MTDIINAEESQSEGDYEFDFRADAAIFNQLLGIGGRLDKVAQSGVNSAATKPLSIDQKIALFATDSFCRAVCETVPQKAATGGWEITLGSETKDVEKIQSALGEYEKCLASSNSEIEDDEDDILNSVADCFYLAQVWANIMDGAAIVLNIDDGQPMSEPVKSANIKTIRAADVLDRTQIQPVVETNWNPLRPNYYELVLPDTIERDRFKGMIQNEKGIGRYYIHRSRIVRFDGLLTTQKQMVNNGGWGASPLDLVWNELNRWRVTQDAIANAVMDHSLFVRQIKGLRDTKAQHGQKGEAAIQLNSQTMKLMATVMGGVTIDMEKEKLEYLQRQFSGIPDIMREFRDSLIGASRQPHTLLFGESPSGLGATGESEENMIASLVAEFQNTVWKRKLLRVYKLIFLAKDGPTKGKPPLDWGIRFNSLIPESESEKATARSTQAQTDTAYVNAGILLKGEVRNSRFGGDEYSFETVLDDKLWKEQQDQANQDPFADYGAMGGGDQSNQQDPFAQQGNNNNPSAGDQEQFQQDSLIPFQISDSRYARYWKKKHSPIGETA